MKSVLFFAAALLLSLPLRAQFQSSSLPEILVPGSNDPGGHIQRVSNYSYGNLPFSDYTSDLYMSTYRFQGTPKFYYKRTKTGDPSAVIDEGMVTVPGAGQVYDGVILRNINSGTGNDYGVAVVYSLSSGGAGIAFYEWTLSGLNLVKQFTFSNDYIESIRMDAIDMSYYTVVFTTVGSSTMYAFGGDVTGTYPLVGTVKQINSIAPAPSGPGGYLPDVAMTVLSSPPPSMSTTGIKDYFAFISQDKQNCYVYYLGFDELMTYASPITLTWEHTVPQLSLNGVNSNNCTVSPSNAFPRYNYSFGPIIDAPDQSNDAWSAIVEQEEIYPNWNSACGIQLEPFLQLQVSAAYKINGGTIHDLVLNNGSLPGTSSVDMSKNTTYPFSNTLRRSQPAVAFSDFSYGQWINFGWGKTEENGAPSPNDYLGMVYNPTSGSIIGTPYRVIDKNPALNPLYSGIAFSGQNTTTNDLYTVFISDTSNSSVPYESECLYQKHPGWAAITSLGYKPTAIASVQDNPLQLRVQPNPFGDNFILSVTGAHQHDVFEIWLSDALGRQIIHAKGNIEHINLTIQKDLSHQKRLSSGLYFLQTRSLAAQQEVSFKLVKQ